MGATVGGAAVQITEAAEVNLDVDFAEDPDPAFGDTWETRLKGLLRFSGSFGGNYDTAQAGNTLWLAAILDGAVNWYMYPTAATTTAYYYGSIFPKVSVRGSTGSRGTFTAAFTGNGALSINP